MTSAALHSSFRYSDLLLSNRVVMPPLSLLRASEHGLCNPEAAHWYSRRANAGLIISELTYASPLGRSSARSPGIQTEPHIFSWRKVTDAVHEAGGHIFLQLGHCGRIGHSSLQPDGADLIAPTSLRAENSFAIVLDKHGAKIPLPCTTPSVCTPQQIEQVLFDFTAGARNAKRAGFDGIELHCGAGYLLDEFLSSMVNRLEGRYGYGTVESRTRLVLESVDLISEVFGCKRVGVRISPHYHFHGMTPDPRVRDTILYLAGELRRRNIGHLHVYNHGAPDSPVISHDMLLEIRRTFAGTFILCGGYASADTANRDIDAGMADLVAFGKPYITNPDLATLLLNGDPLMRWDNNALTYIVGGESGYPVPTQPRRPFARGLLISGLLMRMARHWLGKQAK